MRAVDHPSLLMALPAGFRQGNPREPYEKQYSRDLQDDANGGHDRSRRQTDVSGRACLLLALQLHVTEFDSLASNCWLF